jgi:DNA-binding NarL/FixJ family response regulator
VKTRVYIADDHPLVRKGLASLINAEADMEVVGEAEDCPTATSEIMKLRPDVVIVDIRYIKQYDQSDKKLPGAVFVQPENFDEFANIYPKDKTNVLY